MLDRCCSSSAVTLSGVTTLGGVAVFRIGVLLCGIVAGTSVCGAVCDTVRVGVFTLGAGAILFDIFSVLLSCVAISSKAALTGSPSCRLGTVDVGGLASNVTMSCAACFK